MPPKSDWGQVRVHTIIDFLKAARRGCLPSLPAAGVLAAPASR
jgi:hypothetical protein